MRKLNFLLILLAICGIILPSCSKDDEPGKGLDIIGSWYGTRSYYNPVGGTKYQYLTISFDYDGTGTVEYDTPVGYSVGKFQYKVKGHTINCTGVYINHYDELEEDFSMSLNLEGDRLIPQDRFDWFILTRDNSVMTDGNGNEIIN